MKKTNRIISTFVLVAFLFNTAVQDFAFAQTSHKPDYTLREVPRSETPNIDKLAAPSKLSDLQGMEPKDIGEIEMWFMACLKDMERERLTPITAENLRKFADRLGETVFRPEGYSFFIHETINLGDDVIQIKAERTSGLFGKRTYFIEYNTAFDVLDVYPENKSKQRTAKDAKAIARYKEQNQQIIDKFIRENIEREKTTPGSFAEIRGRVQALGWDKRYPDRVKPSLYFGDFLTSAYNAARETFFDKLGVDPREAFKGKNIVFIRVASEKDYPVIEEDGKKIIVKSHTSQNAVYFFLGSEDFDAIAQNFKVQKTLRYGAEYDNIVNAATIEHIIHEMGVCYGLPYKVEPVAVGAGSQVIGKMVNDLDMAYKRLSLSKKDTLEKYPSLANLKLANLDTDLGNRDYTAGKEGRGLPNPKSDKRAPGPKQLKSSTATALWSEVLAVLSGRDDVVHLKWALAKVKSATVVEAVSRRFSQEVANEQVEDELPDISDIQDAISKALSDRLTKLTGEGRSLPDARDEQPITKAAQPKAAATAAETSPYFIGGSMGASKLYVALYRRMNGKPEVLARKKILWSEALNLADPKDVENPDKVNPDDIVKETAKVVKELLASCGLTVADLNNTGCTSPGPLDDEAGIIGTDNKTVTMPFYKYPFAEKLSQELGTSYVQVRHDARAALEGELALGLLSEVENGYFLIHGSGVGGSLSVNRKYNTDIPELTEPGHHLVGTPTAKDPYKFNYRLILKDGKAHPHEVVANPDPRKSYQITKERAAELLASPEHKYTRDDFIWIIEGEKDLEDVISGRSAIEPMLKDGNRLVRMFGGEKSDYESMKEPKDISELAMNGNLKERGLARAMIGYFAQEMGKAMACLAAASYGKPWQLPRIVIGSTLGEKMGVDSKGQMILTDTGDDYYYHYIRRAALRELTDQFGLPGGFSHEISSQILRSNITQDERETAGFDRRTAPAQKAQAEAEAPEKTVLVVGGAGYIGSSTVREFDEAVARYIQEGYKVKVYDNLRAGHVKALPQGVELITGDLSDRKKLVRVMRESKIDTVIHFAAYIEAGESMKKPAKFFENNVINTLNLLEAMREAGVKNIVFSSSASVYGNPVSVPIYETAELNPTSPYGESKLKMEELLREYAEKYGFRAVALRYFNAAGAYSPDCGEAHCPEETHIIPRFINFAMKNEPITVFGDGGHGRDYINVKDLAAAHVKAVEWLKKRESGKGMFESFNLGTGKMYTNLEIAEKIKAKVAQITRRPCTSEIIFGPERPGDPRYLQASKEKAARILRWSPQHSDIEEIIDDACKWHLSHPEGYGEEKGAVVERLAIESVRNIIAKLRENQTVSKKFKLDLLRRLLSDEINKMRVLDATKKEWPDGRILAWAKRGDAYQAEIYRLLGEEIARLKQEEGRSMPDAKGDERAPEPAQPKAATQQTARVAARLAQMRTASIATLMKDAAYSEITRRIEAAISVSGARGTAKPVLDAMADEIKKYPQFINSQAYANMSQRALAYMAVNYDIQIALCLGKALEILAQGDASIEKLLQDQDGQPDVLESFADRLENLDSRTIAFYKSVYECLKAAEWSYEKAPRPITAISILLGSVLIKSKTFGGTTYTICTGIKDVVELSGVQVEKGGSPHMCRILPYSDVDYFAIPLSSVQLKILIQNAALLMDEQAESIENLMPFSGMSRPQATDEKDKRTTGSEGETPGAVQTPGQAPQERALNAQLFTPAMIADRAESIKIGDMKIFLDPAAIEDLPRYWHNVKGELERFENMVLGFNWQEIDSPKDMKPSLAMEGFKYIQLDTFVDISGETTGVLKAHVTEDIAAAKVKYVVFLKYETGTLKKIVHTIPIVLAVGKNTFGSDRRVLYMAHTAVHSNSLALMSGYIGAKADEARGKEGRGLPNPTDGGDMMGPAQPKDAAVLQANTDLVIHIAKELEAKLTPQLDKMDGLIVELLKEGISADTRRKIVTDLLEASEKALDLHRQINSQLIEDWRASRGDENRQRVIEGVRGMFQHVGGSTIAIIPIFYRIELREGRAVTADNVRITQLSIQKFREMLSTLCTNPAYYPTLAKLTAPAAAGQAAGSVSDWLAETLRGIVDLSNPQNPVIINQELYRKAMPQLAYEAANNPNAELKAAIQDLILRTASQMGTRLSSIKALYSAKSSMEKALGRQFTIPSMNLRCAAFDEAIIAFEKAKEMNVGAFQIEIAPTEVAYTGQNLKEFAAIIAAAAITADYNAPVFLKLDHLRMDPKKYAKDSKAEIQRIFGVIKEAIDAGFYAIDIDASVLEKDPKEATNPVEQQRDNFVVSARLLEMARTYAREKGVEIAFGVEVGEVGEAYITEAHIRAFLTNLRDILTRRSYEVRWDIKMPDVLAIPSGTPHGGLRDPRTGEALENVTIAFDLLEKAAQICAEYGMVGPVQHGASKLPIGLFHMFPGRNVTEIHLATAMSDIEIDKVLPDDVREKMLGEFVASPVAVDIQAKRRAAGKEPLTPEALRKNTERRKLIGKYKADFWNVPPEKKTLRQKLLGELFGEWFTLLQVTDTRQAVQNIYGQVDGRASSARKIDDRDLQTLKDLAEGRGEPGQDITALLILVARSSSLSGAQKYIARLHEIAQERLSNPHAAQLNQDLLKILREKGWDTSGVDLTSPRGFPSRNAAGQVKEGRGLPDAKGGERRMSEPSQPAPIHVSEISSQSGVSQDVVRALRDLVHPGEPITVDEMIEMMLRYESARREGDKIVLADSGGVVVDDKVRQAIALILEARGMLAKPAAAARDQLTAESVADACINVINPENDAAAIAQKFSEVFHGLGFAITASVNLEENPQTIILRFRGQPEPKGNVYLGTPRDRAALVGVLEPFIEIEAMEKIAEATGKKAWEQGGKYNFIMPEQFFRNGDFEKHKKYGDRFNLETVSSGAAGTVDEFIRLAKSRIKAGEENRTVILIPRSNFLSEDDFRKLEGLLDGLKGEHKGIRFLFIGESALIDLATERNPEKRARFQEDTYAAMLLARQVGDDGSMDPLIYSGLSHYLKSHFGFDKFTSAEYMEAIRRGDVAALIKGYISYRQFEIYDAVKENRQISHPLVFA